METNLLKQLDIVEGDTTYPVYIYDEGAHSKIGVLGDLTTENKNNIVNAINELVSEDSALGDRIDTAVEQIGEVEGALNTYKTQTNVRLGALETFRTNASASIDNLISAQGDLTNLDTTDKSSLVNAINEVFSRADAFGFKNVKSYGAVGDNIHDDTQAFLDCIDDCTDGDTVVIPNGQYKLTSKITVNKMIKIVGGSAFLTANWIAGESAFRGVTLYCSSDGLEIARCGVQIEGLNIIHSLPTGDNGISIKGDSVLQIGSINLRISNVNIQNFNFGLVGTDITFKDIFENVLCYNCTVGFEFMNQGGYTSLTFINCWAANCTHGYRLLNMVYSSLINCACDNCTDGYYIGGGGTTSMIACGVENAPTYGLMLESTSTFTIDGLFAVNSGSNVGGHGNLCTVSGCKNVNITNSVDLNPPSGSSTDIFVLNSTDVNIYCNQLAHNLINYGGTTEQQKHLQLA